VWFAAVDFFQECETPHTPAVHRRCSILRENIVGFVLFAADPEEKMDQSVSLVRESSGDFTIVLTFSLLGLALSLLAIGLIGPEYMADLFLLS
jgi:hypothetical protein